MNLLTNQTTIQSSWSCTLGQTYLNSSLPDTYLISHGSTIPTSTSTGITDEHIKRFVEDILEPGIKAAVAWLRGSNIQEDLDLADELEQII